MSEVRFRSTMTPPPGGKFYYDDPDGTHIEARTWLEMEPKMRAFMRERGIPGSPSRFLAQHMCPHMPDWYCSGEGVKHVVRASEARENSAPYFARQTVTFDRISERIQKCTTCPKHSRTFCLTCTGLAEWIQTMFNGRRVRVPEDRASGVCDCCKALEAVVASVEYGKDEPIWEGAPDTCWRRTET